MRGAKPPLRSNIDAGAPPRAPEVYAGLVAPATPDAGAPPRAPEVYAGLVAPATPDAGAPPCTRVTFPTQGKSPKVRQGLCPLESPGACSPPFSRSLRCAPTRAGLLSATTPDRFATLNLWANRSFFLPKLYRGSHFLLSIRGALGGANQWFVLLLRGRWGKLGVRVLSSLDGVLRLPIAFPLSSKKTAGCPVGSTGRT